MGFVMDGLEAEAYDRSYSDRALLRRIVGYFRPALRVMLFVALMVVLNALMDTALPIAISRGIDALATHALATPGRSALLPPAAGLLVGAILLAGVLSWTFNFVRQWYTARIVSDVVLRLRLDAFAAVVARDMSFYDEFPSGKIVSRVTSDSEDFSAIVALTLNLVLLVLLVVLIAGVLFYVITRLALLTIAIAPLIVAAALGFRRIARRTTRRAQRAQARVNTIVQEAMTGITVAKTFRQEATMYAEFKEINETRYQVNLRQGFVVSGIFPILTTIAGLGATALVYAAGRSVLDHTLSSGACFLSVQAINVFCCPVTRL